MAEEPSNPLPSTLEQIKKLFNANFVLALIALSIAGYAVMIHRANIEITFKPEGVTVITRGSELSKAIVLLPSNKVWLNTGLHVKPNQTVRILSSGSIHLASHRLLNSTKEHTRPSIGWVDPNGGQLPFQTDLDNARTKYLLLPGESYGAVLAAIVHPDEHAPNKFYPHPKEIKKIGKDGTISSETEGVLWLVVNDVILSESAGDAYVASQPVLDQTYGKGVITRSQKEKEWKQINETKYFEAFFDDNIGDFLVQIEFL
jgi:hypothetical protein